MSFLHRKMKLISLFSSFVFLCVNFDVVLLGYAASCGGPQGSFRRSKCGELISHLNMHV